MYISFVYKLPMVINIYHSKPEVNLQSASLENLRRLKMAVAIRTVTYEYLRAIRTVTYE